MAPVNFRERYVKQNLKIKKNTIRKENTCLIRMDQQLLNDQLSFEISDYKMLTIKAMFCLPGCQMLLLGGLTH